MQKLLFSDQEFDLGYVTAYVTDPKQMDHAVAQMQMGYTPMVMVDEAGYVLGGEEYLLAASRLGRKTLPFTVYPYRTPEEKQDLVRLFHAVNRPVVPPAPKGETACLRTVSQEECLAYAVRSKPKFTTASGRRLCIITANINELKKVQAGLGAVTVEQLPDRKLSVTNLLAHVRKAQAQALAQHPPDAYQQGQIQLYCGDFRDQGEHVADGTVDLIPTDPPYAKDALVLWEVLGRFAWKKLKPSGLLLAYSGKEYLPQVHAALAQSGLVYLWECAIIHSGGADTCWGTRIKGGWKPLVLYAKPPVVHYWKPFIDTCSGGREKTHHPWQQAVAEMTYFLRVLAPKEKCLIVDPFMGSGSTLLAARELGIDAVGIEKDPLTFEGAKARLFGSGGEPAGVGA